MIKKIPIKAKVKVTAKKEKKRTSPDPIDKTTKTTKTNKNSKVEAAPSSFPIVGIGASAGGLEAFKGFFESLPSQINIAIVVVQHLAPKYKSIMGSLLKRYTCMKIFEAKDNLKIEPNCIYLNPPDKDVAVMDGTIQLIDPLQTHCTRLPIDFFFRSLSEDQGEKAICIVLSGTGTDGTIGLKAVKCAGGMTMAQDENQAKYDSMPRNAINTGEVDFILPVEKMGECIIKYIKHPYMNKVEITASTEDKYQSDVTKILLQVRSKTGQDFSHYKQNTIRRRIERRMAVHQIHKIEHYLDYVRKNGIEVETLYKDLLIGVTNFFRDPDAFSLLEKKVIRAILKNKKSNGDVRVWVPGCSTGEEAYSVAMLIHENMNKNRKHCNVQIFATDIDADAIEFARSAVYPDSIAANVSEERLKRFFIKGNNTYKVKKQLREMLVFATQSIIKDPPFSRLDLVCCRNVLIYMDSILQKKIIPIFHYTLNQNGYMFLGSSESIGNFTDCFSTEDTKWKIYKRKGLDTDKGKGFADIPFGNTPILTERKAEKQEYPVYKEPNIFQLAEKEILNKYAPPFVLVNRKQEVIYVNGMVNKFLFTPTGVPVFDILKMAHEDLRYKLSTLLHNIMKKNKTAVTEEVKIRDNGRFITIDLTIKPLASDMAPEGLAMVIFEEKWIPEKRVKNANLPATKKEDPHITAIKLELKSTKDYLQATVEELETSNEELKSTNEELQSTNEELQSTNEELETSKEEQQSTNEELETVNSELQNKVNELSRSNNDLNNLLASTDIATLFLDTKLYIVRFTPLLAELFNILPSDLNRPIGDITSKFNSEDLQKYTEEVLRTLIPKEVKIQVSNKAWYSMRILPYRTVENMIDGIVVTFSNITELMRMENAQRLAAVVTDSSDAITVQELDGQIMTWNKGAVKLYGYTEDEATKNNIKNFIPKENRKEYQAVISDIKAGRNIEPAESKRIAKDGTIIDVWITITKLVDKDGKPSAIATTERKMSDLKQLTVKS